MARIRTIKPEFFTSEDIVSLCPMARLLYIALWCEADREGRMQWKPRTFKIRYFPADDCDIESLCSALTSRNLVKLYGDGLANIPQFQRHQHINPRESQSLLPAPDASGTRGSRVSTRASTVSDAQVGKERKGRSNDASDASGFDAFWKAYPKKVGKDDVRKWFDRRHPDAALVDSMLAAVSVQAASSSWRKDDGQFIPNPSTWLNQGRWQDELGPETNGHDVFAGAR